jgi:Zn-dependent protease
MGLSWKLGRVAGIDIYVHPTFLLVILFSGVLRDGGASLPLVLSMFGCVLLHEYGHALMARRFGIETDKITLYPIGGVARLRRLPRAPGAEFLIAIAGPAVNFAIVLALVALSFAGLGATPLGVFAEELAIINLVLALFNLIPAFPMDGGRILRALLSGWLGRSQATIIAATLGRTLAMLFGLSAIFLMPGPIGQRLIYVALAAFIYMAAGAEEAQVVAEERRRKFTSGADAGDGVWTAPPGYHWVNRGNGSWQLAPIIVVSHSRNPQWNAPRWQ